MNKLFRRIVAYTLDMVVVLIITQCLAGIPQINRQLNDYNKYYNEYYTKYEDYKYFLDYLHSDLDKELTEEEYLRWVESCPLYKVIIDKRYQNKTITEDEYKELAKETDTIFNEIDEDLTYKIEKNSTIYFVIYLVVVFAYFVGFNVITNGQTLGKKLMRLKIVNSKGNEYKVPIWKFIVRTLILYQPIYFLVRLIGINFLDMNMYYNVTSIAYDIQGYLEMLIIVMMLFRFDGRGLQDFLGMTKVILYDKNGNEVKDKVEVLLEANKKLKDDKKMKESAE